MVREAMATPKMLALPNGTNLELRVRGGGAKVSFVEGALLLSARPNAPPPKGSYDDTVELQIKHPLAKPEHVWIPHLTPKPGNVIADWVFRCPAIVLGDPTIAIAFIADVDDVHEALSYRAWLDYDHPAQTITYAGGAWREEGHVFFVREKMSRASEEDVRLRLHLVTSLHPDDIANPYGMAARWCWRKWGHAAFQEDRTAPYTKYLEHITRWAFAPEPEGWGDSVWQDVELKTTTKERPAGAPVFIVDVNRHPSIPPLDRTWREPRSIWNQVWFSTQRCANGLLRYARQIESADLAARARKMTEIALNAPQTNGLFPAVLLANDDESWRWSNSDRRPESVSAEACHIVDAAFTCRMLLEWHTLTKDERCLPYVDRFVERLLELQLPSGAFPGWVEPDGTIPPELAESPESAVSTILLGEWLLAKGIDAADHPARQAIAKSHPFLEGVIRDGRWEDFETYYSCARWGTPEFLGRRVPRNGVYKQNTLSIAWCAEAFLRGPNPRPNLARRCLDELSLYQAVWNATSFRKPTVGGFGVMNADSEWNDARQSLFAPLYLEAGELWNDEELIERGVSALRAAFTLLYCPENEIVRHMYEGREPAFGPESYGFMMENQGHGVTQGVGTFTIYSWGNGSALAAVALVRDRFPAIAAKYGLG